MHIGPSSRGAEAASTPQRNKCLELFFSLVRACAASRQFSEQNHAKQHSLQRRSLLSCRLDPAAGFHKQLSQIRLLSRQYAKSAAMCARTERLPSDPSDAIAAATWSMSASGMQSTARANTAPPPQLRMYACSSLEPNIGKNGTLGESTNVNTGFAVSWRGFLSASTGACGSVRPAQVPSSPKDACSPAP
jgi:hypothetical protein